MYRKTMTINYVKNCDEQNASSIVIVRCLSRNTKYVKNMTDNVCRNILASMCMS